MYDLEQLSGGHGLLSHSTLPCCGEGKAASDGLKVEQQCVAFVQTQTCSPDSCRCGRAGQGS